MHSLYFSPPKMLELHVELIAPKKAAALDRAEAAAALAAEEVSAALVRFDFRCKTSHERLSYLEKPCQLNGHIPGRTKPHPLWKKFQPPCLRNWSP